MQQSFRKLVRRRPFFSFDTRFRPPPQIHGFPASANRLRVEPLRLPRGLPCAFARALTDLCTSGELPPCLELKSSASAPLRTFERFRAEQSSVGWGRIPRAVSVQFSRTARWIRTGNLSGGQSALRRSLLE